VLADLSKMIRIMSRGWLMTEILWRLLFSVHLSLLKEMGVSLSII